MTDATVTPALRAQWILVLCVLGAGIVLPRSATAAACSDLQSLVRLPDTTITTAAEVAAGAFTPPGGARAGAPPAPN